MIRSLPLIIVLAGVPLVGWTPAREQSESQANARRLNDEVSQKQPDCSECDTLPNRPDHKRPPRNTSNCTGATSSANRVYEFEGLDLDTGLIFPSHFPTEFDPEVDVFFSYNTDTDVHLRVFPVNTARMAILPKASFETVGCDEVHTAILSAERDELDLAVAPNDTVIVRTAEGNTFKLGNAVEHEDLVVDFDFAGLCVSCEK